MAPVLDKRTPPTSVTEERLNEHFPAEGNTPAGASPRNSRMRAGRRRAETGILRAMSRNRLLSEIKSWRWQAFVRGVWLVVLAGVFAMVINGARPNPEESAYQALGVARDYLFDFVGWEASAVLDKALNETLAPQRYMTEEERTQYVRDYLKLVYDIAQLEIQVEELYLDPAVDDPEAASAGLRAERDALRVEQEARQALAEAIIEAQIAGMLAEDGFGVGGQLGPPVEIRFTQPPTILIISPRDRIERTGAYPLEHGLTVDQKERIEGNVDESLGVSSLIVPLGGLAVYPAMLIETGYAPHVFNVGAHEWTHHYLSFYPLGFNYGQTPELYTINETVASIVGTEIGWAVLNRYYPDLAPPPPDYTPRPPEEAAPPEEEPPAFDFQMEMRETRIRVDELLAAGKIEEAERYMEARRVVFVENGYAIRKLNQAYFAFHGAYADEPGATGADPIGPALRELRYYSPSLHDFVAQTRSMTTLEEIQVALERARRAYHAAGG
jgi:hypothetical protein